MNLYREIDITIIGAVREIQMCSNLRNKKLIIEIGSLREIREKHNGLYGFVKGNFKIF
jgi:hypothetical protein